MKLIGRRSVASVMRWCLGFINVFVVIAVIAAGLGVLMSAASPELGAGFLDGLVGVRDSEGGLVVSERLTYIAGFIATLGTWWVINRLRRIFLAVNKGDAFEPANVQRLRAMGLGLIAIQIASAILDLSSPMMTHVERRGWDVNLGAWLGILIVFMLAEVFRQGSAMRDDQQMTV